MALALPARATEWVICASPDKKASFSMLAGSLGIGTATDFAIEAGGKNWSTKTGEGTPIAKLQAFEDERSILVTVSNADLSEVVAELRVLKAQEGEDSVQGGVLRVAGVGAWPVNCSDE